jgi:hypothetical protein
MTEGSKGSTTVGAKTTVRYKIIVITINTTEIPRQIYIACTSVLAPILRASFINQGWGRGYMGVGANQKLLLHYSIVCSDTIFKIALF